MKRILHVSLWKRLTAYMEIFMLFSVVITFLSTILPERYYYYKNWLYRERKWERHGEFYQKVFKIKRWKDNLPELADFVKYVFPKKVLSGFQSELISKYLMESCKAEFTHWCIIFSTVILLIRGDILPFILILLVAIILNMPFIIIQRYNRPRIISIMKHKGIEV